MDNSNSCEYAQKDEVALLQRRVRLLNMACTVLALVVVTLLLTAFQKPSNVTIPDVLTAKKFVLVDDTGKSIASLGLVKQQSGHGTIESTQLQADSVDGASHFLVRLEPAADPSGSGLVTMIAGQQKFAGKSSGLTFYANGGGTYMDFGSVFPGNQTHFIPHVFLTTDATTGALIRACGNTSVSQTNCPKLQQ